MGDGVQKECVRFLSYLFYIGDRNKTNLPYKKEPDSPYDCYRLKHEEVLTLKNCLDKTELLEISQVVF